MNRVKFHVEPHLPDINQFRSIQYVFVLERTLNAAKSWVSEHV